MNLLRIGQKLFCRAVDKLWKIALQEYRIEQERLRTVEHFNIGALIVTAEELTAVVRMREESPLSFTCKKAQDFLLKVACLLNRVEK
jgi:hypothetical protein